MSNKKTPTVFRQGDVLITRIESLPEGLSKVDRAILAFGEVTGHSHTIHRGATAFSLKPQNQVDELTTADYLQVDELIASVTHEEHIAVQLPKGTYKVLRQVEYTPAALVNVRD